LVLVVLVELVQPRKGKPHLELAEVILFLVQLPQLAAAVPVLALVRLRQVGQEAVLAVPLLRGLLGQLGRDIKAEIRQMGAVAVAVQALLAAVEPRRFQQVELLEQVAQVLHLL